ncbi:MAG: hypothetical protein LOD94_17100, partial [Gammaproteobacteria bacterium]
MPARRNTRSSTRKKKPARKPAKRSSRRRRGVFGSLIGIAALGAAVLVVAFATYAALIGVQISREFEARRWD